MTHSRNRSSRALSTVALLLGFTFAAAACSSSSSPSGTTPDGATPPVDASMGDDAAVNGCTEADFDANDHTAASDPRVIQGPTTPTPAQYVPHCIRIKATQTITFKSDLSDHPIDVAVVSGAMPNTPVIVESSSTDGGAPDTEMMTIAQAGTIKFNCDVHPLTMLGAIEVVP